MNDTELREAYSADNLQEAHLVKAALEEVGIEAHVVGEHLQNAIGDLPSVAVAPRIWVHADQFDKARKIILDQKARRETRAASPASPWKCDQCGEGNEPSFELCWKCQTVYSGESR